MRSLIVLCLFAAGVIASERYTDRYDNIDLDEILANRRILLPYIKCILDQGKCSPDAKELRMHITEALEEDCAKCTETQRKKSKRVIAHFIKHEKDYWIQMRNKYDPEDTYVKKYDAELQKLAK